jgi:[acyl-carrier-protein] S-malonyltransferase
MKTAFLFPGQGAQQVGMGKDLYESTPAGKAVFDRAEAVTGLPLKKLCFEGPEEELARTDICQPAIFTVSAALLAFLDCLLEPAKVEAMRPAFTAGLSLGEYTALYAADMIDFDDAIRLVARRGAAMQSAATAVPSGMVSIMGLDPAKAGELAKAAANGDVLSCANFNCPGQVVLSGSLEACKRAEAMAAKDFGASGAIPLDVAGAFHSAIMRPAADELAEALGAVEIRLPRGLPVRSDRGAICDPSWGQDFAAADTQVVSNVDAVPYACNGCVKGGLLAQLTSPVRWQQSMEYLLAQGVTRFYEIGPGRVLAGLMRRIHRKAEIVSVNSAEAVEKLAAE